MLIDLGYFGIERSKIVENELKCRYTVNGELTIQKSQELIRSFWRDWTTFGKFKQRCKELGVIEKYLGFTCLNFDVLQVIQPYTGPVLTLIVTNSKFPHNPNFGIDRKFKITNTGLLESPRYNRDRLVLFGRESQNNFLCDVSMPPDSNFLSEFHMIIACMSTGFGLVDCSKKSNVFLRVIGDRPRVLKQDTVIQIGLADKYEVSISQNDHSKLCLKGRYGEFKDQELSFDGNQAQEYSIGSSSQCSIRSGKLELLHAVISYDFQSKQWSLSQPLNPENGRHQANPLFIRLKTVQEQNRGFSSKVFLLNQNDVIKIASYTVFVSFDNITS